MTHPYLHRLLAVLLVLLAAVNTGWGQGATTAAMNGTITDKAGMGLPGATVIAVHTPTNTQYVAPTNSDGRYNIQNMRVGGPYAVRVTFVGYQETTREGIFLNLGQNLRLDVNLSETTTQLAGVEISGRQDPVINAGRTGAATTVQREQIERLPTLNRSFADFTRLTPQANGLSFGGRNGGYNNITIDGAVFNNAFGLSSTIGGQAGAQPISVDALEQIQVNLAPYDVRQGSFTGAGINAVTRSGSNKVSGSAYFYNRNESKLFLGRKVGDVEVPITDFRLRNYGVRLGGPIIKDKVFFFVSAERERRTDPPSGNFTASNATQAPNGTSVSQASELQLTTLSNFLAGTIGNGIGIRNADGSLVNYVTGPYQGYNQRQNSDKITAKIDWNISSSHRFNIKYNYLKSFADVPPSNSGAISSRSGTAFGLPFQSAYYTINNNLNSLIGELNSTFGSRFSNNLTVGYTAGRDFRTPFSSIFPFVEIGNNVGLTTSSTSAPTSTYTSFGYEPFTAGNLLNSDIFQVGDNLTAYLGKHNVTLGTYNEFYKFKNGFAPNYNSYYRFNSLEDFYSANGYSYDRNTGALTPLGNGVARATPSQFQVQYAAKTATNPNADFPYANIKTKQYGVYLQDEFTPVSNLRVTAGIRADLPVVDSDVAQNDAAAALNFRDGVKINTSQLPKTRVLFSPRIGFNYDVFNNKKTQLRGGTGIFTGRVPFVWISNQASNNGVLFGSIAATSASAAAAYQFSPDPNRYVPASRAANASYNLAVTDREFKFPQVWRHNLAVDQELGAGFVATLEGFYTKDLNSVYQQNVNLPNPVGNSNGADTRPIFYTLGAVNQTTGLVATTANNRINSNISDAIKMTNTKLGYSYALTAQVQKSFSNGLFTSLAYTYSDSRSVNDGGSIAQSQWRDRSVSGDPNANVLSYSQFLQRHRIVAAASYKKEYIKHLATTLSLFYSGGPLGRFSYLYAGDMNGDSQSNDLVYVPRNRDEINLRDLPFSYRNANNQSVVYTTYTADQQWADLDAYINQDKYLSKRRGSYAERNGGELPWLHQVDLKLIQDLFVDLGENRNTLQLSVDIFNVGNLLNSKWGNLRTPNRTALLSYQGYNAQGQPVYQYRPLTDPSRAADGTVTPGVPLSTTFRDNVGSISSRWQAQVGIRYIFN